MDEYEAVKILEESGYDLLTYPNLTPDQKLKMAYQLRDIADNLRVGYFNEPEDIQAVRQELNELKDQQDTLLTDLVTGSYAIIDSINKFEEEYLSEDNPEHVSEMNNLRDDVNTIFGLVHAINPKK